MYVKHDYKLTSKMHCPSKQDKTEKYRHKIMMKLLNSKKI